MRDYPILNFAFIAVPYFTVTVATGIGSAIMSITITLKCV